jgi:hypothetical protein
MPRHHAPPRSPFAARHAGADPAPGELRQQVARGGARFLRLALAPFAALAAAAAGLVYVILLPICGIASIAASVARASWAAAREAIAAMRHAHAPRT